MNRRGFLAALFGLPFVKNVLPVRTEAASISAGMFYCPYIPLQFPNHARIPTTPLTFKTRYDIGSLNA